MENSNLWDPPNDDPKPDPRAMQDAPAVEQPDVEPLALNNFQTGYAQQAAAVAAWKAGARRNARKAQADMSYGIMKTIYGAGMRSRPLILTSTMTPAGAPKVGVAETISPEQYAPDGQTINVMTPQWRNGYKADIAGGTGANYSPAAGDVGKSLSVAMTPATAARPGIAYVSDPTFPVTP